MKVNTNIELESDEVEEMIARIEYQASEKVAGKIYHHADVEHCIKETVSLIENERAKTIQSIVYSADDKFKEDFVKKMAEHSASRIGWMLMSEKEFMNKLADLIVEKLQAADEKSM
jgi:predicted RND superfamily exporter protein